MNGGLTYDPIYITLPQLDTGYTSSWREMGTAFVNGQNITLFYKGNGVCVDEGSARFAYSLTPAGTKYDLPITQAKYAKKFFEMRGDNLPANPSASMIIVGTFSPLHSETIITGMELMEQSGGLVLHGLGLTSVTGVKVNGRVEYVFYSTPKQITIYPNGGTNPAPWMNVMLDTADGQKIRYYLMDTVRK